jgi:hypothetical protein
MTVNDAPPPDPHEDRLNRARGRERMAADYDDAPRPPRAAKSAGLSSLIPVDRTTRLLTFGAAGLGALLLVGIGGWSLIGHRHAGVPVFGPPSGPIREKPLDPGGMDLNGMMPPPVEADASGEAHLAPAPEQPDPAALAAQYGAVARKDAETGRPAEAKPAAPSEEQAAREPTAQADTATGNPASAPEGQPQAVSRPVAPPAADKAASQPEDNVIEEPATGDDEAKQKVLPPGEEKPSVKTVTKEKPVAAVPGTAAPRDGAAPEATGLYGAQLAALNSEDAARKEWERLKEISPDLFAGHTPLIEKTVHTNAIFYRLRTRGFANIAAAQSFCNALREHGHACNVLRP